MKAAYSKTVASLFLVAIVLVTLVSAQKGTSVVRRITFQRGRTSAIVSGTLKRGTSHDYLLRANRGQQMIVHLATKADMGFEIMTPSKDVMAEYTQDWTGPLPMSGDYRINVLPPTTTEAPASYTLEVTVR